MASFETLPGETPIGDISGLKIQGISTRGELNRYEAENVRKAMVKYLGKRPGRRTARYDLAWGRRLHKEMFGDVWAWAGEFRTCSLHLGVEPQHIETSLYQMLDNVAFREKSGMDIVEQAVLLHHEAARVHPFMNGNGRWARLLADIWLRLHRAPVVDWPADFAGTVSPTRADYIEAMKAADQGDLAPLTELHRRYTAK